MMNLQFTQKTNPNKIIESPKQERGLTGLVNLGNTCFLNSCIQILSHTHPLNELLNDESRYTSFIKHDTPDATILKEWNDLRKTMWSLNGTISPKRFVNEVQKVAKRKNRDLFTGFSQNDLSEFLLFLIESMHNSICRPVSIQPNKSGATTPIAKECFALLERTFEREYSEIMELCYGIYVSEIRSIDGLISHTMKAEMFCMLDLEIPIELTEGPDAIKRNLNLYDCLNEFTCAEIVDGDNAWLNEKTGQKEDIQKRIVFWNFPPILMITLKRFSYDGVSKITNLIEFPIDGLDLNTYVQITDGIPPTEDYKYDLYGVCSHYGRVQGGHYTSFVRRLNGEWNHFNDNIIQKTGTIHVVSPQAYCLFYRRRNG